ncbi:MAG TPA: hypothetical protein VMY88_07250 [Acidimicrobiales bacterium]|nr:hypothetical protein [Acidimicrobiales bacterium]
MSDQTPVPGPDSTSQPPTAPPARMACPRCRGTFEGSPDACPHCGFTKAEAAQLNSQATITAPLNAPAAQPEPAPQPTPAPQPQPVPDAAPEGVTALPATVEPDKKSRRWLLAVPLVLVLLAGGYWWMTKGESQTQGPADQDACTPFREELLEVQGKDFPNEREERRAEGEVRGRALEAGCEPDELRSET